MPDLECRLLKDLGRCKSSRKQMCVVCAVQCIVCSVQFSRVKIAKARLHRIGQKTDLGTFLRFGQIWKIDLGSSNLTRFPFYSHSSIKLLFNQNKECGMEIVSNFPPNFTKFRNRKDGTYTTVA